VESLLLSDNYKDNQGSYLEGEGNGGSKFWGLVASSKYKNFEVLLSLI
jgi:hypothetical protein